MATAAIVVQESENGTGQDSAACSKVAVFSASRYVSNLSADDVLVQGLP
jgi:hypothetical protein